MTQRESFPQNESERDDDFENEDIDPKEYDAMLRLERLESLEEDMVDLNVTTLDEVRQRIRDLHQELGDEH